jgi:hypothetical protein
MPEIQTEAPFGCADKPAEKHCWLICCERKILFQLKKTDYKPDEQSLSLKRDHKGQSLTMAISLECSDMQCNSHQTQMAWVAT